MIVVPQVKKKTKLSLPLDNNTLVSSLNVTEKDLVQVLASNSLEEVLDLEQQQLT